MKKITVEFIQDFIRNNEIPFLPTQSKLSVPIIDRLCQKMFYDIKFDDISVCDNLIIDGHHRYLSSLIMKTDIGKVLSHKTAATQIVKWGAIEFDKNDWDTASKISYLNQQDAIYNGMDIEFVKQITLG